tara:strand:+ start:1461 stop:2051 length:591 start_codon:yes stop_codon:yes gene_type:complete
MIKLGILGDIGSGKSFVAKLFGYPVFSADKEVSEIYKKDRDCYKKLKKKLPKYVNSFPIKKKQLSEAYLDKKSNLKIIEKIVHPKIQKIKKRFIIKNKKYKILVFDIPLILETKNYTNEYVFIFVKANKKDIHKYLKRRKNLNIKIINNLRKSQLSLEFKKKKSNYIIKNDFKILPLKKRVKILKNKILKNERIST